MVSSKMATHPKIVVVGGGLAGLAAVIKIVEMGGHVDLFSIVPVKRSHSVCAQGGINAAMERSVYIALRQTCQPAIPAPGTL